MKNYQFTKGNGVKKEYSKGKFVHVGVISATRNTAEGVVLRTDICEFKHSGKHQYFLSNNEMTEIKEKLNGTNARKYFNV